MSGPGSKADAQPRSEARSVASAGPARQPAAEPKLIFVAGLVPGAARSRLRGVLGRPAKRQAEWRRGIRGQNGARREDGRVRSPPNSASRSEVGLFCGGRAPWRVRSKSGPCSRQAKPAIGGNLCLSRLFPAVGTQWNVCGAVVERSGAAGKLAGLAPICSWRTVPGLARSQARLGETGKPGLFRCRAR